MDRKLQEEYNYFRKLLDDNGINYSGANFDIWKMISIEPKDIEGFPVEVDFSDEGIIIKYQKEQEIQELPVKTIDELIRKVSDITKIKIKKEYTDFVRLLIINEVDYSGANFDIWKMISIEPKDIEGSPVEIDFSDEGIIIKYRKEQEIQELPVKTIDELIKKVSDITKIDFEELSAKIDYFEEVERGAKRR